MNIHIWRPEEVIAISAAGAEFLKANLQTAEKAIQCTIYSISGGYNKF